MQVLHKHCLTLIRVTDISGSLYPNISKLMHQTCQPCSSNIIWHFVKSPRPWKDALKLLNFSFLLLIKNTTEMMPCQDIVLVQNYLPFSALIISFPICYLVSHLFYILLREYKNTTKSSSSTCSVSSFLWLFFLLSEFLTSHPYIEP